MCEDRYTASNLNKMLDRLEQIQNLSWNVKYSSVDLGCEIESKIEELEDILESELAIREQALIKALLGL